MRAWKVALMIWILGMLLGFITKGFVLGQSVKQGLANLTLVGAIVAVLLIFMIGVMPKQAKKVTKWVAKDAMPLSFIVAFTATAGSLFYSEYLLYTPCLLCWYQRIFMYPLVIIFGVALIRKSKEVIPYVLPISILGALIALYHYMTQMLADFTLERAGCAAQGGVDCSIKLTTHFGFITIPLMAAIAFTLITLFILLPKKKK